MSRLPSVALTIGPISTASAANVPGVCTFARLKRVECCSHLKCCASIPTQSVRGITPRTCAVRCDARVSATFGGPDASHAHTHLRVGSVVSRNVPVPSHHRIRLRIASHRMALIAQFFRSVSAPHTLHFSVRISLPLTSVSASRPPASSPVFASHCRPACRLSVVLSDCHILSLLSAQRTAELQHTVCSQFQRVPQPLVHALPITCAHRSVRVRQRLLCRQRCVVRRSAVAAAGPFVCIASAYAPLALTSRTHTAYHRSAQRIHRLCAAPHCFAPPALPRVRSAESDCRN